MYLIYILTKIKKEKLMKYILIFCIAMFISGCNSKKKDEVNNFSSPITVTKYYFDNLYNKKDINGVISASAYNHKKTVESYGHVNNVSRHIYGINFEKVDLDVRNSNKTTLSDNKNRERVVIYLTGYSNGQLIKEYMEIITVKENDEWKVEGLINNNLRI